MLLLSVVALKEIHHLLDHHHEVAHCDNNGRETHLHSEEYAPVDCLICFFHLSANEFQETTFQLKNIVLYYPSVCYLYKTPITKDAFQHTPSRGPPASSVFV